MRRVEDSTVPSARDQADADADADADAGSAFTCASLALPPSRSSSQSTVSPAGSPLFGSLSALEPRGGGDNQSEASPTLGSAFVRRGLRQIDEDGGTAESQRAPPPVSATTTATASATASATGDHADAFDLWSGWTAHAFGSRTEFADSSGAALEWRGLRSLSIDETPPPSGSDALLPLEALSHSLRSLAVAKRDNDGDAAAERGGAATDRRPRSFSDYSCLGVRDHEPTPSPSPSPSLSPSLAPWASRAGLQRLDVRAPASPPRGLVDELWKALKTTFATRHVLVQSVDAHLDPEDVRRISDAIHNFGSVVRMRAELASEGLLLFTFRELRSAISAVKALGAESTPMPPLFSPAQALSRAEAIHFSLPYELPDEANCATVAVTLEAGVSSAGEPAARVAPTAVRQFCSRFGEVASVMQTDTHARNRFFVEFNDCRVVSAAVDALAAVRFSVGGGRVIAERAASPTLDVSKIQRFQECVEQLSTLEAASSGKTRPKSFSSTSTSILTSPTSSVASSLNASFLEAPLSSSSCSGAATGSGKSPRSSSRTLDPAASTDAVMTSDERAWSRAIGSGRVRSSSMYASVSIPTPTLDGAERAPTDRFRASTGRKSFSVPSSQLTCATYPPTRRNSEHYDVSGLEVALESNQFSHCLAHDKQQSRTRVDPSAAFALPPPPSSSSSSPPSSSSSFLSATKFAPGSTRVNEERPVSQQHYRAGNQQISSGAYQQSGNAPSRALPGQGRHDQGTGEFCLSIDRVASGEDSRTTLMVRNIPNKYTQQMLLAEINQRHRGQYDFFYLPIDFKNKCNMGYAFINFMEADSIIAFYREFDGQRWTNFNSEKVCAISYARLQGKQAMIARFQNSSLLDKHESYRPLVFVSAGPDRGQPEHFPAPKMPTNASHRKHQCSPPPIFSASPYPHHYHPHPHSHSHAHRDELFVGAAGSARTTTYLLHSQQPLPYHPAQQQLYPQQLYPQQPSVLVVDPHQAQAFFAAQVAVAAAITPGRANYSGMYEDPRYPHLHQHQQQQQPYQQSQRRVSAYESFERRQTQGFSDRARYSS